MTHDYVIVGAGTAGCVLANRLSADPGAGVLLLEAGGKDDYFWIDIPVGYLYTIGNPRTDWCYRIEPDPGLNGRSILYARGRVLGGCSSINAMIYMRGSGATTTTGRRSATAAGAGTTCCRCSCGRRTTSTAPTSATASAARCGSRRRRVSWEIPRRVARRGRGMRHPQDRGVQPGRQLRQRLLPDEPARGPALERHQGVPAAGHAPAQPDRATGAQVRRITVESGDGGPRATEIELVTGERIEARRGVILAAGAVGSPQILQLSGIGPGALLQQHGIEVVHDLPGVGENLHDHLQIRTIYKVQNTVTLNVRVNSLFGKAAMGLEYLLFKTGPMTMPRRSSERSRAATRPRASANMEWHVQPLSLDKFGDPLHRFNAITPSVANLQPTSRGHVRIKEPDPLEAPAITLNYLSTDEDLRVAVAGLRFTRRIMAAPALARFEPEEWKPGPEIESDEALVAAARDLGTTIFHPVGTCKMGRDPLAVVDDRLAVHGVKGLRVIDASVMPRITSGNTNAPR